LIDETTRKREGERKKEREREKSREVRCGGNRRERRKKG
jgi:hypothetical protein